MRIRTVKPEFFRDPDSTGRWSADLKVFYIGMWCVADDEGRFVWDEDLIAADLYPFDRSVHVDALLGALMSAGVLVPYEADGRKYGLLKNFKKHQKINHPSKSKLPAPVVLQESSRSPPENFSLEQGSGNREQGTGSSTPGAVPLALASTADEPLPLAPWEQLKDALADRMAVPRDWLRVAAADRTSEVREQLDAEVQRLGLPRAVEVAAEAASKAKSKPRWLAYFVGPLQDARRNPNGLDAWQDAPRSSEWRDEQGRTLAEIQAAERAVGGMA